MDTENAQGTSGPGYRKPRTPYERELEMTCRDALRAMAADLAEVGLTATFRGVMDARTGSAEMTIDFEGPSGIEDVLEFTITRDGRPTLDADQLRLWLAEALRSVVASA